MTKPKVAFFSSKPYDELYFNQHNDPLSFELEFFSEHLSDKTAHLANGFDVVCAFVNDKLDRSTLNILQEISIRCIALRCAGYNNLDVAYSKSVGIPVVRVPSYSPQAVAEHVIALTLTLFRHTHKAYNRVREGNFSLSGLIGQELYQKTVGIVGTGQIGIAAAKIFNGFGCKVIATDPNPIEKHFDYIEYVSIDTLFNESDIISLHCPLNNNTQHLINESAINQMKTGVTLINTGRGGLIDTEAVYKNLKNKKIGALGLDVYEEEANLFFEDLSTEIIMDDLFMRLTTFPNVLITGHQGFFTNKALNKIALTTLKNIELVLKGEPCPNVVQ